MKIVNLRLGKRILKKLLLAFLFTALGFICIQNVSVSITISDKRTTFIVLGSIVLLYIIVDSFFYHKENHAKPLEQVYFRSHHDNFSPSLVSLLADMNVSIKKDILADLLYLESKKIIKIDYQNFQCEINNTTYLFNDNEAHLKFLYDFIATNQPFYIKSFFQIEHNLEWQEFRKLVHEMGIKENIIFHDKRKFRPLEYSFLLIVVFFLVMYIPSLLFANIENLLAICLIFTFFVGLLLIVVGFVISLIMYGYKEIRWRNFKRTKLGKEKARYWLGYYDYLTDFTRLYEKDIRYNQLLESDYAYALAFGINKPLIKQFDLKKENDVVR